LREFAKRAANIIINDLKPGLGRRGLQLSKSPIKPEHVAVLVQYEMDEKISRGQTRYVIDWFLSRERSPSITGW
jgi:Asp-tRNA(Asn)/Glu-tRNA(Gln) amidotransferase B subunit